MLHQSAHLQCIVGGGMVQQHLVAFVAYGAHLIRDRHITEHFFVQGWVIDASESSPVLHTQVLDRQEPDEFAGRLMKVAKNTFC